ncbi:polysaccharide pyruvyl transferase family protein [Nesterenkonia flava]|uniref:Polysaccharide pyruvyl transferase family protein n=1 Tax=Nesterenkonia flava TaxID=469799 RepID=A0ABU1FQ66_9MICC|nr:polysaccharide pyruvyl transferase family protein [Nesterenkonia flava]MDR5710768.1 polysaccharide pyruvyl transferase family protein [Nesterenkonia flava]
MAVQSTDPQLLEQLNKTARTTPSLIALGAEPEIVSSHHMVRFPFNVPTGSAVAYLQVHNGAVTLNFKGHDKATRQALRRILLGAARLAPTPAERHEVITFDAGTSPRVIMKSLSAWLQSVQNEAQMRHDLARGAQKPSSDDVFGFWADVRSNFGDQIGPWLVQELTGKRIINSRYSKQDHGRMLATVGSIIQMLPTSATSAADIWGTGLMRKPSAEELEGLKKLQDVTVHAVRGKLTRELLIEHLGWDVPEVYGDPALLFPRFFTPDRDPALAEKVAFVPHFKHIEHHFANAAEFQEALGERAHVVDVHADLRDVITQIASARACVSSSLHGIIIAQAYGVPWVWLYAPDKNIGGNRFKFDDFFSTLTDPENVATHSAPVDEFPALDFTALAEQATLPATEIDLDALQQAFPLAPAKTAQAPLQPRFRWSRFSAEERFMSDVRAAYRLTHCR